MWKVIGTVITTILTVVLSNMFTGLLASDPPERAPLEYQVRGFESSDDE